jgi:hypothetical protein
MPRTTTFVQINVAVEHVVGPGVKEKVIEAVEKAVEHSTAEEAITDALYNTDADFMVRYLEVPGEVSSG